MHSTALNRPCGPRQRTQELSDGLCGSQHGERERASALLAGSALSMLACTTVGTGSGMIEADDVPAWTAAAKVNVSSTVGVRGSA